jgi:hypothetical protein
MFVKTRLLGQAGDQSLKENTSKTITFNQLYNVHKISAILHSSYKIDA